MFIDRFAGDNKIMQAMSLAVQKNEQLMKARHDDHQRIMARQKYKQYRA